jgi:hypothetical protein
VATGVSHSAHTIQTNEILLAPGGSQVTWQSNFVSRPVSSYCRAVGHIPMSVRCAERTVCSCWYVVCPYRKLGSGNVRSGLSLPHLMGAFVVLAVGLLLAVISLLIELGHRHVTAAPAMCLQCAS